MKNNTHLQFARGLLDRLMIPCSVFESSIPCEIDLGLRAMLYGEQDYSKLLKNSVTQADNRCIYCFADEYMCKYIFMRLSENGESYFFVGPYLLSFLDEETIKSCTDAFSLTEDQFNQLKKYYGNLPVLEDEKLLLAICGTLGAGLWGEDSSFRTEYISYPIPDSTQPINSQGAFERNDSTLELRILEELYASEKLLMDAVSQGQLHRLSALSSAISARGIEKRLPDSLRNRKNYLIILKTILRKAAEYGGVHPMHIDRLSSDFSAQIEALSSLNACERLQNSMIHDYCMLVKNHSLKNYSYLVGKAVTIISYDLTADLSLKSLAAQLNVNGSYLSGLFRKECGCTLTEYVCRKRIEHAVYLLSTGRKNIQSISYECGIGDANYFNKLFKRETGMTPTQYRAKYCRG